MPQAPQQMRLAVEAFLGGPGPVVDVRSPGEFRQGHIVGAHNLPLFDDDQRAQVGTTYKQQGRQAAVLEGLGLVGPRLDSLGEALLRLAGPTPQAPLRLHCWRGGMRSGSVAWLAATLQRPVVLLEGGYKAYRQWVLAQFERPWPLRLLGGRTGSGKTELLLELQRRGVAVVDLEGLANHRGSSFGGLGQGEQPSTEQFENLLATALWPLGTAQTIWLEDESAQVGRCRIPAALWRQMKQAPLLAVQRPLDARLDHLVALYGNQGRSGLADATQRIAKRLGPQRTALALEAIAQENWREACRQILDYYDRCYDHGLQARPALAGPLSSPGQSGGVAGPQAGVAPAPRREPQAETAALADPGLDGGGPAGLPAPGNGVGQAAANSDPPGPLDIGRASVPEAAELLLATGLIGPVPPRLGPL